MNTRLRIDPDVSGRLDILKLLLVCGVVLIHAERAVHAYMPDMPQALRMVTAFLGMNLLQGCVPLFFVMSGYLFAVSYTPGPGVYLRMLGKKMRTIGLPYLFYNSLAVAIILIFRKIPYIGDFHTIDERGIFSLITGIGGLPIISPLWFLRDLLVMFALAPVFHFLAKRAPFVSLAAVALIWNLADGGSVGGLDFRGVFFFHAGYVVATTRTALDFGRVLTAFFFLAYPAALLLGTYLGLEDLSSFTTTVTRNIGMVLGVPFFWRLSAFFPLHDNRLLLAMSGYSFFLYLLHEPTLSYLIYLSRFVFTPTGTVSGLFLYFSTWALTIALVLGAGVFLARRLPAVYGFLTGFRFPSRPAGAPAAAHPLDGQRRVG